MTYVIESFSYGVSGLPECLSGTMCLSRKDSFLPILKENIMAVVGEDITGKVEEIDKEIKLRQAELLRPGNSDKQIEVDA